MTFYLIFLPVAALLLMAASSCVMIVISVREQVGFGIVIGIGLLLLSVLWIYPFLSEVLK